MKTFCVVAALTLGFAGSVGSAAAQGYYGDRGYGYEGRGYGDRGYGDRGYGFDEREYLRCNPDVWRAVRRGQMESGFAHYRMYGRREHRRLSC